MAWCEKSLRSEVALACGTGFLLIWGFGCRPADYKAPPKEPDPRELPPAEGSDDEIAHRALFGVDSAPPSVLRPPKDATISPSGVTMSILRAGTGDRTPRLGDTVIVHFTGWDQDGERFDSSIARGKPDRLRVEELVPGWREATLAMVVGEKRRLWLPEALAFGPVPSPGRPAGDVVLEVELLEIIDAPVLPSVPEDLNNIPSDAETTASGLRSKILKPGRGERRPAPSDSVVVHYSGWTLDGKLFDSSVARGEPAVFGVTDVIPGWTEALQLMRVGEKRRVWIPADLAYGETPARPGSPAGNLVFDIELVEIEQ